MLSVVELPFSIFGLKLIDTSSGTDLERVSLRLAFSQRVVIADPRSVTKARVWLLPHAPSDGTRA